MSAHRIASSEGRGNRYPPQDQRARDLCRLRAWAVHGIILLFCCSPFIRTLGEINSLVIIIIINYFLHPPRHTDRQRHTCDFYSPSLVIPDFPHSLFKCGYSIPSEPLST